MTRGPQTDVTADPGRGPFCVLGEDRSGQPHAENPTVLAATGSRRLQYKANQTPPNFSPGVFPTGGPIVWCRTCKKEYEGLACRACVERRSRDAFLELQTQYVPSILSGDARMHLSKPAGAGLWHIVLVGEPRHLQHAYCGVPVKNSHVDTRVVYSTDLREKVCGLCLDTFDRLVEDFAQPAKLADYNPHWPRK